MGKLKDKMDQDLKLRGLCEHTRATYVRCARAFVKPTGSRNGDGQSRGAGLSANSPIETQHLCQLSEVHLEELRAHLWITRTMAESKILLSSRCLFAILVVLSWLARFPSL